MSGKQPKRNPRPGVDEYGRTPLHYAARDGAFDALVELLKAGSLVDAQDDNGWTALHFAAQDRHFELIDELLKRGANPNLVNSHGNSPLCVAILQARGNFTIAKRLLAAGTNPDLTNAFGRSARHIVADMGIAQALGL